MLFMLFFNSSCFYFQRGNLFTCVSRARLFHGRIARARTSCLRYRGISGTTRTRASKRSAVGHPKRRRVAALARAVLFSSRNRAVGLAQKKQGETNRCDQAGASGSLPMMIRDYEGKRYNNIDVDSITLFAETLRWPDKCAIHSHRRHVEFFRS